MSNPNECASSECTSAALIWPLWDRAKWSAIWRLCVVLSGCRNYIEWDDRFFAMSRALAHDSTDGSNGHRFVIRVCLCGARTVDPQRCPIWGEEQRRRK